MEWVSIGLSLSAVAILLRYATRPRCPLCARRHDRRVVVVAHEPRPESSGSSTPDRRPIRWRADPFASLPAPDTDVASLN